MSLYIPNLDPITGKFYEYKQKTKDDNLVEEFIKNKKSKSILYFKKKTPTFLICKENTLI